VHSGTPEQKKGKHRHKKKKTMKKTNIAARRREKTIYSNHSDVVDYF